MKILSLTLNSTHLKGLVFDKQILTQFECPLSDYTPFFFDRLGLDLSTFFISFLLPDSATLYKEKTFHNVPRSSLKTLINFYEKSLFPFEDSESYCVSKATRDKKSLCLKTSACMENATTSSFEDLKNLGLYPDFLASWQKALHAGIAFFLQRKNPFLVFYIKNTYLFIEHIDNEHILFSTVVKTEGSSSKNLEAALTSLKSTLPDLLEIIVIGTAPSIDSSLKTLFSEGMHHDLLDKHGEYLLLLGSALLAQKNTFDLLKPSWVKAPKLKISLLKKLTQINAIACGVILCTTLSFFIHHNQSLRSEFKSNKSHPLPMIISQEDMHKKMRQLESLVYLEPYIPQVPSPSDVMAFFSAHPVLNQIDKYSGKNTSIHHLDYSLIDLKTARIKLSCQFPQSFLQALFEKDLKQRQLSFTSSTQAHLTHYEFIIKKGYTF